MRKVIYFFVALAALILWQCQSNTSDKVGTVALSKAAQQEALLFMETHCYTCHDPGAPQNSRIAPPMIAIKRHYLDAGLSRAQFIDAIADFVANPQAEKAKMPGAVRKFGVMPKLSYNEDQVRQLAAYIHDFAIEQPEWFEAHYQSRHFGAATTDTGLAAQGLRYATAAKGALGRQLMKAIQKGGPDYAVAFCNTKAYPITDSIASKYKVSIKRVSDKPRNPNNTANAEETGYIAYYQSILNAGQTPQPKVIATDTLVTFYHPIVTNAMCLKCHGTVGETIALSTKAKIDTLYPADKATGYATNEVRGLWRISWQPNGNE